ncbi:MAG: DUF2971 domain-containing protein [Acetobacter sp.]|nr:DUF2971 domain-containing protein [Acetobacter sp.]
MKKREQDEVIKECRKGKPLSEIFDEHRRAIEVLRENTYIASFSIESNEEKKLSGRLSMWRSYGANGIAIVFNEKFCTKLINAQIKRRNFKIACGKVFYVPQSLTSGPEHNLQELRGLINLNQEFTVLLSNIFYKFDPSVCPYFVKHDGFQEEFEWRLVIEIIEENLNQGYTPPQTTLH